MPETPEIPLELAEKAPIVIGPTGTTVIFALAIYGATCATMDIVRTTKRVRLKRKLKQEEQKANEPTPPTE